MSILTDILRGITKPGRDVAELGRLVTSLRKMDPNINKELDTLKKKQEAQRVMEEYQPKYQSQEEQLGTFLRPGETIARDAAVLGSLIAPVGIAGNIASRAGAGAFGAGLGSYGMTPITENADIGKILASAGLGGILGGTIGAVEKGIAGRAARGGESGLTKLGKEMEKGATGIKTPKTPLGKDMAMQSFDDVKRITNKYKANPDITGIGKAYKGLSNDLTKSLRASQVTANADDLALNAAQNLADNLGITDDKALSLIQATLKRSGAKGTLNAQGLANLKSATQPVALRVQKLIDTGGSLTPSTYAEYALNRVADDILKSGLDDVGKAIYQDMAILHKVAPDIVTKADKAGHITVANIKVPTAGIPQKAQALTGKAMQSLGGLQLPKVSEKVMSNIGNAGIYGTRLGQAIGYEGNQQQPQQLQQPMQSQMPQEDQGISAINMMLAQAVLNKQISATEANAVLSLLGLDAKSTQSNLPKTDTGRKAMVARDAAIRAYQLLQESPDVAGKTAGIENLLYGLTGAANQSTAYKSQIEALRSQMFNALGGSSLTPTEKEQYEKFLPKVTDSAARARQKIEQLVPMLEALMGASISSTETLEQY